MGHADSKQTLHYAAYSQEQRAMKAQREQRFAGLVTGQTTEQGEPPSVKEDAAIKAEQVRVHYRLTAEQLKTLRRLARGVLSHEALGRELGIDRSSAFARVATLLKRFNAANPVQVCVKAAHAGLLVEQEPTDGALT